MARICAVCGKKLGVLTEGISINENMELCSRCYSAVNVKYIVPMNKASDVNELNAKYKAAMENIERENLTDAQKEDCKEFITSRKNKNVERIQQETESKLRIEKEQKAEQAWRSVYTNIASIKNQYMVTTGYNFEGYKIIEYKKVISGSTVLGTGFLSEFNAGVSDFFGIKADSFADKLEDAKEYAYDTMLSKAIAAGANAIIGVDFDYITFQNNMIGVVANGTAVVIEKN